MKTALPFTALLLTFIAKAQVTFEAHQIDVVTAGLGKIISADLDGDGDMDVVALSGGVIWYENLDGMGNFSSVNIIVTGNYYELIAADLDGDGALDIISTGYWFKNLDGLGNFGPGQTINDYHVPNAVATTDIDYDGDLDVYSIANINSSSTIFWQENLDGMGTFAPINIILEVTGTGRYLSFSDVDGDGDSDILIGIAGNPYKVGWLKNLDGQGNFGALQIIASNSEYVATVVGADMDNDGDQDVVAVFGNAYSWFENTDGQGTFGNQHVINQDASSVDILATDLDNDGDMDVVCINHIPSIYYLNDGSGSFGNQQTLPNSDNLISITAADINGDGNMDVVASTINPGNDPAKIKWFENQAPLGTMENSRIDFNLYPNPTNGLLNIQSASQISEISVYNVLGKMVASSKNTYQIDISALSNGLYSVKIIDIRGHVATQNMVKN